MSNKRISIFVNASPLSNRYYPLLQTLGDNLCCFYGPGIGIKQSLPDDLYGKTKITGLGMKVLRRITPFFLKLFGMPLYYGYWLEVKILDYLYSSRLASDDSKIVFINPLFCKSVEKAKKSGKYIVVEAGNSEPVREHERIMREYEQFKIDHVYIYGNVKYRDTCLKSFNLADKIVAISEFSEKTYIDANYDITKLVLIPMTGTDYPVSSFEMTEDKPKAFISTAYHSFIKGTHRLLLAWKKAQIEDVPLIIIGNLCEDIEEFINKYGPFENVHFEGYVKGSLKDYYKKYNAVGVLMSLSEGAVRTTPEFMSFGYPMIVSSDAACDIVKDQYNGFIVETTDVDKLSERLRWFAEDWERVNQMRDNVLTSVSYRSVNDYSMEVAEYLKNL